MGTGGNKQRDIGTWGYWDIGADGIWDRWSFGQGDSGRLRQRDIGQREIGRKGDIYHLYRQSNVKEIFV